MAKIINIIEKVLDIVEGAADATEAIVDAATPDVQGNDEDLVRAKADQEKIEKAASEYPEG